VLYISYNLNLIRWITCRICNTIWIYMDNLN